jgi:hypothetical protein
VFELAVNKSILPPRQGSVTDEVFANSAFLANFLLVTIITNMAVQSTILNLLKAPVSGRNDIFKLIMMKKKQDRARFQNLLQLLKTIARFLLITLLPLQMIYSILFIVFGYALGWPPLVTLIKDWIHPNAILVYRRSDLRIRVAKCLATLYFFWALLSYLFWPVYFVWGVISAERYFYFHQLPEQESPRNATQWSTYVGVGLALAAALRHRICSPTSDVHNIWTLQSKHRPTGREKPWWLLGWEEGWYWLVTVQEKWEEFVAWWNDPLDVTWREEKEARAEDDDTCEVIIWEKILYPERFKGNISQVIICRFCGLDHEKTLNAGS